MSVITIESIMKEQNCTKEEAQKMLELLDKTFKSAGSSLEEMNKLSREMEENEAKLQQKVANLTSTTLDNLGKIWNGIY